MKNWLKIVHFEQPSTRRAFFALTLPAAGIYVNITVFFLFWIFSGVQVQTALFSRSAL